MYKIQIKVVYLNFATRDKKVPRNDMAVTLINVDLTRRYYKVYFSNNFVMTFKLLSSNVL